MKKFIKNFFILFFLSLFCYVCGVYVFGKFAPERFKHLLNLAYRPARIDYTLTRLNDLHNFENVDLLILGSSHVYRSFDPRIFQQAGYSIFDLGTTAQTPIQSNYLLQKYLSVLNPDTVVIEVYPLMFTLDGIESTTDIISNENPSGSLVALCATQNSIKAWNTLIYSVVDRIVFRNSYHDPLVQKDNRYISGGYIASPLKFFNLEDKIKPKVLDLNEKQLDAFYEMVTFLKDKNIPYMLVQAPYPQSRYKSYQNVVSFNKMMHKAGSYFNFNELMKLPNRAFQDNSHLNQAGAERFNSKFIQLTMD